MSEKDPCPYCGGTGSTWVRNKHGKVTKVPCDICKGSGKMRH